MVGGVDLDVEESMSLAGVGRLGTGFLITLSPVASALSDGGNLSDGTAAPWQWASAIASSMR